MKEKFRPPATELDVNVLLAEVLGGPEHVERYLDIRKEKGKPNILVKPKGNLPYHVWLSINRRVHNMGGRYSRKENLWIIELQGR